MPRLRRYLPPLLILLPVIFICGKLLLTPVPLYHLSYYSAVRRTERGWPWAFQTFEGEFDEFTELPAIGDGPIHPALLAADVVVLMLATGGCAALLALHYRRHGSWFKISLR